MPCNLSWRRLFSLCDACEQLNQSLVCLKRFGSESRERAAEVVAFEFGVFIHCTREETFPDWTIRHEADSQLFEGRNDFYFRRAGPQRIFALESSEWLNFVRPTDSLHSRFREPKCFTLPC